MNEQPVPFDRLPPELILKIIIRVPFCQDDFLSLLLVDHRFNQIMVNRGWMIFNDIAKEQYSHAFEMKKYPYLPPFSTGVEFTTQKELALAGETQQQYDDEVDKMAEIGACMQRQGVRPKYFGVKGWKYNVITALYANKTMQEFIFAASSHYINPHMLGPDDNAWRCETFINCLPVSYCLAMRFTTLMRLELINFLGSLPERYAKRRGNRNGPEALIQIDERSMKIMLENLFQSAFTDAAQALESNTNSETRWIRKSLVRLTRTGQRIQNTDLSDMTEMMSHTCPRFDQLITRRVAATLENWDDFAAGEGRDFIQDMERIDTGGAQQQTSTKIFVESFLGDLTGF
jgi:hypothetical protein